jgi:hypothetical protein
VEDALNSSLRYFSRFVEENSIDHLLVGEEVEKRYQYLSFRLNAAIQRITDRVSKLCPFLPLHNLPSVIAPQHWSASTDLLRVMRAQHLDRQKRAAGLAADSEEDFTEKYLRQTAGKRSQVMSSSSPSSPPSPSSSSSSPAMVMASLRAELTQLMKETKTAADRIGTAATLMIDTYSMNNVLPQVAVREFWMKHVHPAQELKLNDFCKVVHQHLKSKLLELTDVSAMVLALRTGIIRNDPNSITFITVTAASLGRLFRFVNPTNEDFIEVLKLIATFVTNGTKWNVPAFPMHLKKVFFARTERNALIELLSTSGLVGICGPSNVGKTTRLLSLIHSGALSAARDICYIDMDRICTDTDAVTRIASELNLTKIRSMPDLLLRVKDLLSTYRPNSVIVLDNVDIFPPTTSNARRYKQATMMDDSYRYLSILTQILGLLGEFSDEKRFCVCVVSHEMESITESVTSFRQVFTVHPLQKDVAAQFIESTIKDSPLTSLKSSTSLLSSFSSSSSFDWDCIVDVDALYDAAGGLPGHLLTMLRWCSTANVRTLALANNVNHSVYATTTTTNLSHHIHHELGMQAKLIQQKVIADAAVQVFKHDLSHDERLLACCLYTHTQHFDAKLCWNMSREVFGNDLIRWKIAFDGLLALRWLVHRGELGYCVSCIASLITPTTPAISEQELYDNYILHWVENLVHIDELASRAGSANSSALALEYFSGHLAHYKQVFENIFVCGHICALALANSASNKHQKNKSNSAVSDLQGQSLKCKSTDGEGFIRHTNSAVSDSVPTDNKSNGLASKGVMRTAGGQQQTGTEKSGADLIQLPAKISKSLTRMDSVASFYAFIQNSKSQTPNRTGPINVADKPSVYSDLAVLDPRDMKRAMEFSRVLHRHKTHQFQSKPYCDEEVAAHVTVGSADAFSKFTTEFRICYTNTVLNNVVIISDALSHDESSSGLMGGLTDSFPTTHNVIMIDELEPFEYAVSLPVVRTIAKDLMGSISHVLVYHFTPVVALRIAQALHYILANALTSTSRFSTTPIVSVPHDHGRHHDHNDFQLAYDLSLVELAEQDDRAAHYEAGLKLISKLVSKFYDTHANALLTTNGITVKLPVYAARAMTVYGRLCLACASANTDSSTRDQGSSSTSLMTYGNQVLLGRHRANGIAALTAAAEILASTGLVTESNLVLGIRDGMARPARKKFKLFKYMSKLVDMLFVHRDK